jgi:hypothetical protein
MFDKMRLRRRQRREIREKKKILDARTKELDAAMNLLAKKHPVVPSIEELYLYIPYYAHCNEEWEDRYCKRYLWDRVRKGYLRIYDDSRLTE